MERNGAVKLDTTLQAMITWKNGFKWLLYSFKGLESLKKQGVLNPDVR